MPLVKLTNGYCFHSSSIESLDLPSLESSNRTLDHNFYVKLIFPRLLSVGEKEFYKCKKLQYIVALNLKSIPKLCFSDCAKLEFVITPNASIEESAFHNCKKLHTVLSITQKFECKCRCCSMCTGKFNACLLRGLKLMKE